MALITSICKKHGGHVEEQCPECAREAHAHNVNMTEEFFLQHGKKRIILRGRKSTDSDHWVSVDDLFQYFRIRILNEIHEE